VTAAHVRSYRPAGHEALARRAKHFDSSVHFGLDEPDAMQRLHAVTKDLRAVAELDALLPKVLEGRCRSPEQTSGLSRSAIRPLAH